MSSQSEVLDKEIDLFMIEAGIAVYQVGDVYDARETGELLSDEEKSR
ncbi:hypothetical protein [Aquabacterium soli]|nr:hypothetical protein [Aquabacterium soli]